MFWVIVCTVLAAAGLFAAGWAHGDGPDDGDLLPLLRADLQHAVAVFGVLIDDREHGPLYHLRFLFHSILS